MYRLGHNCSGRFWFLGHLRINCTIFRAACKFVGDFESHYSQGSLRARLANDHLLTRPDQNVLEHDPKK